MKKDRELTILCLFWYVWRIELVRLNNQCAKGSKGETCNLEALLTEGDTDKGNAENNADKVAEQCKDGCDWRPNQVCERMSFVADVYNLTEGEAHKSCNLEALLTERNTDESYAESNAHEEPNEREYKTARKEPEKVSELLHFVILLYKFVYTVIITYLLTVVNKKITFSSKKELKIRQ